MKHTYKTFFLLLLTLLSYGCSNADVPPYKNKVTLGIDKLISSNFNQIKGKRVGLFTNYSGRTSSGKLTAEVLASSKSINLKYIFSPEHGFYGGSYAGESVQDDEIFGVELISLYGANRRPKLEHLQQLDVVLIDIQDIGIRSYTFLSSVNYMLTSCAEAGIPVIVLDRPNPIGGNVVDGMVTEKGQENFMSLIPVPYIHGLTLGEIVVMMNDEGWLKNASGVVQKCNLSVIEMSNWQRNMRWEDCNLLWFPTSPQIPSPEAVYGAATLGIFGELSILNIGIGTSLPFRYIGAPTMNEEFVYQEVRSFCKDDELLIQIAHFKPFYGKFSQQYCKGLLFSYPKCDRFAPFTTGVKTILAIRKVHPELFILDNVSKEKQEMFRKVTGSSILLSAIFGGKRDAEVVEIAQRGVNEYLELRKKYLRY
ncbi:MAG: DUF1343 domain-containing protein [Ignavibacteria bacterium]|nr:DUF1343 domain-containing protein [Ignavibacteria bacterium]